ncbi:MAG: M14 family zinc carboxypeptidase [Bacteroidales bacterium]|nr:M14 family zinc carboxypeptidase [Bacteroidales bacterium]
MRKIIIILALISVSIASSGQAEYYFPGETVFNNEITSPWEFLGYDIGSHHSRYDVMIDYLKTLADESGRVRFEVFGYSEELRPQIILTITSPSNYDDLESIRLQHLELTAGTASKSVNAENIPLIIQLGFNVHGNEASGGEASLLAAYYLAAAEGEEINTILNNSVIFIEPVLNPDGRDRFTSWANMNRSKPAVSDPNDREHNEAWPGGRTNHYWFDLNRDWLPLSQVESRNRVQRYHEWLPNVTTDHHEMGTNSTFFFEPTKKGSENPIITSENYVKLNNLFAAEYAKALNEINHYYDSGRSFDNLYPGYGSSYGDMHGGLAILFEQASSRGLVQETDMGNKLTFSLGIKNQLFAALTTVRTAINNKELLNDYMRRFFNDARAEAVKDPVKAYVFGAAGDNNRSRYFLDLLLMHNIEVRAISKDIDVNGIRFEAGKSWFVPTNQKQYKMVRTMFEPSRGLTDSLFYDASSWAMVYSYGIPFAALQRTPGGELISELPKAEYQKPDFSEYAYVFNWSDYNSALALYYLQKNGIRARAAWDEFSIATRDGIKYFARGSVFVPVRSQDISPEKLHEVISEASEVAGISINAVSGSVTKEGPWLGNSSFKAVMKPEVLMLTGGSVSSSNAGALWHFFDTKLSMPLTKTDINLFGRIDLYEYNTLILPSGSYTELTERDINRINEWVSSGGNLIAISYAFRFLENSKLAGIKYDSRRPELSEDRIDYDKLRAESGKHSIGGIYCRVDLDISHPLGFGYADRELTVYRNHAIFVERDEGPASNIAIYTDDPLISGFCTDENLEKMKGSVSLLSLSKGRGNIIVFVDDPVFRACWYGTNKLLMNAIFFGPGI